VIEAVPGPFPPPIWTSSHGLLVDAVESGASVSFMNPFSESEAREWWRKTLEQASPRAIVLVARDERHSRQRIAASCVGAESASSRRHHQAARAPPPAQAGNRTRADSGDR
jgi:hypothetical protein